MSGATSIPVRHGDKFIHFGLYALLVWLGGRRIVLCGQPDVRQALLRWAVIYAVYAVLDEWLQSFVGRTASVGDWLCDVGGITIVSTILIIRASGGKLSERQGLAGRCNT
jgi:VanZ family protein